jgi:hypothetical protein
MPSMRHANSIEKDRRRRAPHLLVPALSAAILVAIAGALIAQADPLARSRQAIAGKTFHAVFSPGTAAADVRMGKDGRPRIVRWGPSAVEAGFVSSDGTGSHWTDVLTHVTEYTGRPARRCGAGAAPRGELVVGYEHRQSDNTWTATAFALAPDQNLPSGVDQALAMLRNARPITIGGQRRIGERPARELIAEWKSPYPAAEPALITGDPLPNVKGDPALDETIQSLWIDTESSLPQRWEVTRRGIVQQGFDFRYETIDLQPPAGVRAPDCVQE